jgi:hypothetical protein
MLQVVNYGFLRFEVNVSQICSTFHLLINIRQKIAVQFSKTLKKIYARAMLTILFLNMFFIINTYF